MSNKPVSQQELAETIREKVKKARAAGERGVGLVVMEAMADAIEEGRADKPVPGVDQPLT